MLKLPEHTIAPGVEFVLEECVQVLNLEQNYVITNCVMYLLNNAIIIARRHSTSLSSVTSRSSTGNRLTHNRCSSINGYSNNYKERLEVIVPIKHGTSLLVGENMSVYKNALTIQSVEGETCTFICDNEEDVSGLRVMIKKQIDRAEKEVVNKLKLMFRADVKNEKFLKNMAMLELIPDVHVLGTTERNDKMLKYTVYIVEVKIKMVRQKIFVRFS